jgi:hypothetical protein
MTYETEVPASAKLLDDAKEIILGSRNRAYGEPEDNFARIAEVWNWYLVNKFDFRGRLLDYDVALLMDLLKTARLLHDPTNEDSWKDKAGYVGCGWGCVEGA